MDMDRRVLWIAGAGIAILVVGRPRSSPDAAAGTPAVAVASAPSQVRGTGRVDRASLAELGARIAVARRDDDGASARAAAGEVLDDIAEETAEVAAHWTRDRDVEEEEPLHPKMRKVKDIEPLRFIEDVEVISDAGSEAVYGIDVDISSTITIDHNYIRNIPVGRTFESVLGTTVGDGDADGVSFSSGTTLENTYVIDF
jgi:hypothetical protein